MWGQHLIVDMGGCERAAVTSDVAIRNFCNDLVEGIGMVAFGEPIITHFAKHDPKASGYTLVQLIETSAVTAHFAEQAGDIYLDVFSCKEFSTAAVLAVCRRHFSPTTLNHTNLSRAAGQDPQVLSTAA